MERIEIGTCRICAMRDTEVRNINLYVFGSEGVDVCASCDTLLREFISSLARRFGRTKILLKKERMKIRGEG